MRNLKKVLAVILTVALLASMMMVPALAAVSNEDEATALKAIGLFKGVSDTDFGLEGKLSRDQAMAFVIRTMGVEDEALAMSEADIAAEIAKFADGAKIASWARPYAAYALKNGITTGVGRDGKVYFDAAALMPAENFITLILRAMGYADVDFANPWDAAVDAKILTPGQAVAFKYDTAFIRDEAVGILYTAVKSGISANGKALVENLIAAGAVDAKVAFDNGFVPAPPAPKALKVESVTANNMKEFYVAFSAALDKTTAETAANYSLNPSTPGALTPKLMEDGKTVKVTVATNLANQGAYKLTVEKVKDAAGVAMVKSVTDFTAFDSTLPTADSVTITGPSSFDLVFSEPIKTTGTIEVKSANTSLAVNNKAANNTNKISVTLYSSLTDGVEYSITVKDYSDFANYNNVIKTFKVTYTKDATPPTVTFDSATQQYAVVKFSKPVTNVTLDHFYQTYTAWKPMAIYKTKAEMDADTTGNTSTITNATTGVTTVYVRFATDASAGQYPLAAGNVNLYVLAKANNFEIKDNWGNKFADAMVVATVNADAEAPTVSKVEVTSNTTLKITFSEAVANAATTANYGILNADGTTVSGLSFTTTVASDNKSVTLNLSGATMVGKTFILNVKDVTDTSLNKNKMAAYSVNVTFEDKSFDGISRVEYDSTTSPKVLYVVYNEVVNDTALNIANYRLDDGGTGATIRTLSGATSFFGSNKVVKIELSSTEAGYITTGTDKLLVASVEDANGNKASAFQLSQGIVAIGTVPAGLHADGIRAIDKNTVTVQFNQELANVDPLEFALCIDSATYKLPTSIELTNNSKGTLVTLKFADTIPANVPGAVLLRSVTSNTPGTAAAFVNTQNVFGVAASQIVAATPADKITPTIVTDGIETQDTNGDGFIDHLKVTFSEALQQLYISPDKFTVAGYTVVDAYGKTGGAEVYDGRGTATIGDSATVMIRVTQKTAGNEDAGAQPALTIAAGLRDASTSGNAFAAMTTASTPKDKVLPTVKTAMTAQLVAGASANIVFSEELSAASKTVVQNAIDAAKVSGTLSFSWSGRTLTVTNTHAATSTAFAADVQVSIIDLASPANTTANATVIDLP